MDIYRTYDRIERNLPGQGAVFTTILVETYKQYGNVKSTGESEESLVVQALEFCRNKQAQSRARITGTRGSPSSSGNTIPMRGKRIATANRRSRVPAPGQPSLVRESNLPLPTSALSAPPPAPVPSSSNVMQEAMKLLQSAGGSAENLPQHLKNIPGISNLLALFSNPTREPSTSARAPKPDSHLERVEQKKELPVQKSSTSTRPTSSAAPSVSSSSLPAVASSTLPTTASASSSIMSSFANATIPNLGYLDPNMLALLANPYVNPLNLFTGPLLGSDPSTLSKLQQEYQQQLMSSMQNAIAQSYVMSSLANPFLPPSRSRGRGGRKPSSRAPDTAKASQAVDMSTQRGTPTAEQPAAGTSSSASTSAMDLSGYGAKLPKPISKRSSETSHASPKSAASRSDSHSRPSSSLPLDLKIPPPHFEDALKGVRPQSSSDYKKSFGSQADLLKGKSTSPSQNTSPSHATKLPATSSIDVAKFLAELPPSLDLKRLPKAEKRQSLPSAIRSKPEDQKLGSASAASTSKPPASNRQSKTSTISFPINLGKEITLTTTSSSKAAFPMPMKPTPKSRSQAMPGVPHSSSSASSISITPGFPHTGGASKHEIDPLSLVGFSILQNLPSSMSLLVRPPSQAQDREALPREAGDKKGRATEPPAQLPKLTPAPNQVGSKKGKPVPISRPPSLQPNSSMPPFAQSGNPLLPRASTSQKGYQTQHGPPSDKSQKKDPSNQPDIVTLD